MPEQVRHGGSSKPKHPSGRQSLPPSTWPAFHFIGNILGHFFHEGLLLGGGEA
jgi:hypothetical protein